MKFSAKWYVHLRIVGTVASLMPFLLWYLMPRAAQPTFMRDLPAGGSSRFPVEELILSSVVSLVLSLLAGLLAGLLGPEPRGFGIRAVAAAITGVCGLVAYSEAGRPGVPLTYLILFPVACGLGAFAAEPLLKRCGLRMKEEPERT